MTMQSLKARVRNGRLVMDEPTDLPEGEEVELFALDPSATPDEAEGLAAALSRERHAELAERVSRVHAGGAATMSLDEVEQSLRRDLDF